MKEEFDWIRSSYLQQLILTNICHKWMKLDKNNEVNIVIEVGRVNEFVLTWGD